MDLFSAQAEKDFADARLRAFMNEVAALVRRRPNELVSFDLVRNSLPIYGSSYRGVQEVPVDRIVGTTSNRYADFDSAFLPAQARTKSRWKRIDELRLRDVALPPIQLFQVGDVYFVRDGHHRVSVARQVGQHYIDAEVIEMRTRVPLSVVRGKLDSSSVEALGEYAAFLEKTHLDQLRPDVNIHFSQPGGYARLLEHIIVHQYFVGLDDQRTMTWEEAVTDWYDNLYCPIVDSIRDRSILKEFPGRTEADLYLWITDHHYYLAQQAEANHRTKMGLDEAAQDYTRKYSPRLARKVVRVVEQLVQSWRASNLSSPFAHEMAFVAPLEPLLLEAPNPEHASD